MVVEAKCGGSRRRCAALGGRGAFLVLSALAACASGPATPEQREAAELRLLAPYLRSTEVGCAELVVEMTANFHPHVSQPAVDKNVHRVERRQDGDAVETIWTNVAGDTRSAFKVRIGEQPDFGEQGLAMGKAMTFTVVNQFRLRVLQGRRELTLDATAGGGYVVVKDAGAPARELREFAIANGVYRVP
jgi:hypothetical protein